MEYPIEHFCPSDADPDDWGPIVEAAQATITGYGSLTLRLQAREYRFNSPLRIWSRLALIGPDSHGRTRESTRDSKDKVTRETCTLYFPSSAGVIVERNYDNDDHPQVRSECAILRNLTLRGGDEDADREHNGIELHSTALVENVTVRRFPGAGMRVVASVQVDEDYSKGNCNFALFRTMHILECGGPAVITDGGDVNHIDFQRIEANDNGRALTTWSTGSTCRFVSATASGRIVELTLSAAPVGLNVGDQVYASRLVDALDDGVSWTFGFVTAINGTQVTVDTSRDQNVVPDGALRGTGDIGAVKTISATSVTAAGGILRIALDQVNPFRPGDILSGRGFLAASGSGDWTFGLVTPCNHPLSSDYDPYLLEVDTTLDEVTIADGAYSSAKGLVSGRPCAFYITPLIQQNWENCSVGAIYNGGEGFVSVGGASVFLNCYEEGTPPSRIYSPAMVIGGTINPGPGTPALDADKGMFRLTSGAVSSHGDGVAQGAVGSAQPNVAFEYRSPGHVARWHHGLSIPAQWELAEDGLATLTVERNSTSANTVVGRGQKWFPRGFLYGGTGRAVDVEPPSMGASPVRRLETGTIGSVPVEFSSVFEGPINKPLLPDKISKPVDLNIYHGLASDKVPAQHDARVVVRNVAGTTGINGLFRGRGSSRSRLSLYDTSTGAPVQASGEYTAGTGWASVLRARGYAAAPPTDGLWFAGDLLYNLKVADTTGRSREPVAWVCVEMGTPGRWSIWGAGAIVEQSATAVTVGADDEFVLCTAKGARTVQLPAISAHRSRKVTVKDRGGTADTAPITVLAATGETIDGAVSATISAARGVLRLVGSGTEWSVM